ncbi:acyltransferase family protein [Paracoccus rhizosphaerae]|uniref:Acyltransferase family protein n=1 Tax=Paracoccus rhizosphaerae TaxID=1133347 RepID=A0ABV6CRS0_9RHOB|nr:acyltransferase [Paracoccus rhizosphaerae]
MRGSQPAAGRLDVLQAGRAAAAILVVLYHANNFVLPLRLYDGDTAWRGFGWGYAGVEFFFVLSGFIIARAHHRDVGQPTRILRFLYKRCIRILPMYWLVLTTLLVAYQLVPTLGAGALPDTEPAAQAYLLVPSAERSILPVAWTLKHEMVFYSAFVCFLIDVRWGAGIFFFWMGACMIALFLPELDFPAAFFLSPYNLLFAAGLVMYFFQPVVREPVARALVFLGIAMFIIVGLSEQFLFAWPLGVRTLAYGVAACAVIAGSVQISCRVPTSAVLLGNASYAIYLLHLPVMNVLAILLAKSGAGSLTPPLLMCLGLSAIAVAAGAAAHVIVEKPMQQWLVRKSLLPRLSRRSI